MENLNISIQYDIKDRFKILTPAITSRVCSLIMGLILIIYPYDNVKADNEFRGLSYQFPVDFSLSFSQKDLDLMANGSIYPVRQRRLSAELIQYISSGLITGLVAGSSFVDIENDVATTGLSLNGSHLGLILNGVYGDNIQVGILAQYIYQEGKGENQLRSVSLTWHEWLAEITLKINLGPQWHFLAGAGHTGLDIDRRVSGDINETIRMKLEDSVRGRIEVGLHTTPTDHIRLNLYRGAFSGAQLTFAHSF